MLKFTKDKNVKMIDPKSSLIEILKEDGWVLADDKKADDKKAK